MVYRGTLKGQTQVAIKTFKAGTMDTEAFLEEAELMKKLKHKNILSLLAIQTKAEPIMIGKLIKFLQIGIKDHPNIFFHEKLSKLFPFS